MVLKPTTFREDEVLFRAISPGGTSLASDADFIPASTAVAVVTAGGVGAFSATDLRRMLTGKAASARPTIGELEEGLTGSSSKRDIETMFQLIYLAFTAPRPDPAAFTVLTGQIRTMLANQKVVPEQAFVETLQAALSQDHLRRRLPTAASVDQWNLDRSLQFYKDRFADASDFTFVFVGSFTPDAIKPLVERYLGGLPSTGRKETWKDVGVRTPTDVVVKNVERGTEPKSQTAIVFTGPFVYDQTQRVVIRAMADVLEAQLLSSLREELGGTYSVSTNATYNRIPRPEFSVSIEFGSDPTRIEALVKRVFEEIDRLKTTGPSAAHVNDIREAMLREFDTNSRQNGYLLSQIIAKYQSGEDPAQLWDVPNYYKKIDAAMIVQAARTYLNTDRYVRVTLAPEKR